MDRWTVERDGQTAFSTAWWPFGGSQNSLLFQNFEVESSKKKRGRKANSGGRRRSTKHNSSDSEADEDAEDSGEEEGEKAAKKTRGKPKTPARRTPKTPASGVKKGGIFFFCFTLIFVSPSGYLVCYLDVW